MENSGVFLKLKKIILPEYAVYDRDWQFLIYKWVIIGLLIRIIFMPFTGHNDFLSEHIRVAQILRGERFFTGIFQFLPHYIDVFFTKIFSPLLPELHSVFATPETGLSTAEISDFLKFSSSAFVWRYLFILKIPYLIFDFWSGFLVLKILKEKESALRVFKLWMINPVIIYTVYIFGRFEIYSIFLIILSFYFLYKKKNLPLSFLSLGAAVVCRGFILLIIPIILVIVFKSWLKRFYYLVLSLIPLGIVVLIIRFMRLMGLETFEISETMGERFLAEGSFLMVVLRPFLNFGEISISIISFVYVIMILFLILQRKKAVDLPDKNFKEDNKFSIDKNIICISVYCVIFFIIFYIFSNYSAHWFSWFIPFLVILIYENKKYLKLFYILTFAWVIYWIFATDLGVFSTYLLVPLGGKYFHDIASIYLTRIYIGGFAFLEYEILKSTLRAVFAAVSVYIIYSIISDTLKPKVKISGDLDDS